MKKVFLIIGAVLITLVLSIALILKIYLSDKTIILQVVNGLTIRNDVLNAHIPDNSVMLQLEKEDNNSLFKYLVASTFARRSESRLYLLSENSKDKRGNFSFNTKSNNLVHKIKHNKLTKLYLNYFLRYGETNRFIKFISKVCKINIYASYANDIAAFENGFFAITKLQNNTIYFMKGEFDLPIFSFGLNKEFLEQSLKSDTKKNQQLIKEVSAKNTICMYMQKEDIQSSIGYHKQAIKLATQVISNPKFFIFSDNEEMVKQGLAGIENIEFVDGDTPSEDLYIMSKCANNIVSRNNLSWWAAQLNQNNGLIIAPYHFYDETFFQSYENKEERYEKRAIAANIYPKNWVLLDEQSPSLASVAKKYIHDEAILNKILSGYLPKEFNIYTGNRVELEVCKTQGDFRDNLCFSNSGVPTVVTAYYDIKSKHSHDAYLEWAKNFLKIPFNLVVYTDKENSGWIKQLRGTLPLIIIEKNMEEFENHKLKYKYQDFAERDIEVNHITGVKHHSAELYMIWNEKVKFINEVIKINPYKSNFFVWCDIGTVREKEYVQNNFTKEKLMIRDKITFFMNKDVDSELIDDYKSGAQGNIQVGDTRAWQVYDYLYTYTKEDLIRKNIMAAKDQTIMSTMVIRYPELFNLIYYDIREAKDRAGERIWWYGLIYYANKTTDSNN